MKRPSLLLQLSIAAGLAMGAPALKADDEGITRTSQYSRDGRTIASSSTPLIDLWDVGNGRLLRQFQGHTNFVNALVFSSDGRTLASGSYDCTVRLWDTTTGKEIRLLKGPEKAIAFIALSADGKTVAAGGYDKVIWLWDVATGNEISQLAGSQGEILFVAFSPDGKTLASGGCEHVIRLWDVATGKEIRQLVGNRHNIRTFAFTPDSKTGISGGCDHSIRVWELATGKELRQFVGHNGDVFFVTLSPDGKTLASASHDGSVRLWDVAAGTESRRCGDHAGGAICVAFAPDGRTLISGGYDKMQHIWETASGKERLLFGTVPAQREAPPEPTRAELEKNAWQDLAADDGRRAHRAVWALAKSEDGLALLRERLKPAAQAPFDQARAKRLIDDLDSEQFKAREKASAELAQMGRGIVPLLQTTLSTRPGPEVRSRIEKLLHILGEASPGTDVFRQARVIEALEYIGTRDAQNLLQTLARGSPNAELTRQAQDSLARLRGGWKRKSEIESS